MSKRTIPDVPREWIGGAQAFAAAVKDTLERITGRRGGTIKPLPKGASTDDIVAKINELIDTLQ